MCADGLQNFFEGVVEVTGFFRVIIAAVWFLEMVTKRIF
jgi:hypothetical protein